MKTSTFLVGCAFALAASSQAMADDPRWRDCRTCHQVEAPDGSIFARGGRSGPNLFGIANRPLAAESAYRFYSEDLLAAAQTGARWTEDNFVAYLSDPDQFLRSVTGDPEAESGMHIELRSGARELFAYLQALSD